MDGEGRHYTVWIEVEVYMVEDCPPTEQLLGNMRRGVIPVFEVRSQRYFVSPELPEVIDRSISPEHGQSRYTPD